MPGIGRTALLSVVLALSGGADLAAQQPQLWLGGTGRLVGTASRDAAAVARFNGYALGLDGRVSLGPLFLDLDYVQGILRLESDREISRSLVEGGARLGLRPVSFLEIYAGPRARAYATELELPPLAPIGIADIERERWVLLELGGRAVAPLYRLDTARIHAFIEGQAVLAAATGDSPAFDQGRGGTVGMLVRIEDPGIGVSFSYTIDETRFGPDRSETVDAVILSVGILLGGPEPPVTSVFRSR